MNPAREKYLTSIIILLLGLDDVTINFLESHYILLIGLEHQSCISSLTCIPQALSSPRVIIKEILVSIEDNLNVKAGKYYLIT